jgi:hypothetical protein
MPKSSGPKPGNSQSHGGERGLKVRVRTAKHRKLSSTRWLERQLNDPYVAAAKREGFRSRSAFKLIEIDDKYRLLKPGDTVVDLGAAPGGWSQVAAARVEAGEGGGRVVAQGTPEEIAKVAGSHTGRFLAEKLGMNNGAGTKRARPRSRRQPIAAGKRSKANGRSTTARTEEDA